MNPINKTNRREFLKQTTCAAAIAPLAVHAGGRDVIKVGLIGCGGRGTGAAAQALQADANIELVAMGDLFADRLETSLNTLAKTSVVASKVKVKPDHQFVGWDAFKQVLASDVDSVILTTPPHFRPAQLKAAIAAGKHVFAEKPVAVDAPGIRSVLESCELAKKKNLSVVSGLCLRFGYGFREIMRRIHEGEIGDIHTLFANDYRSGIWYKERQPSWTDMHYQMRNWYYYTWLSGDFNVEQHVHYLDVCAWAKGDYPVKAVGMGGREVRNEAKFGNIFDHHSVVYEFADGARLISNTRQIRGCKNDMSIRYSVVAVRPISTNVGEGFTWTGLVTSDGFSTGRITIFTRPSTMKCLLPFVPAIPLTMANIWQKARCLRSWDVWQPIRARK